MQKVVGVRFRRAGKIYYFDPGNLELLLSRDVIVETSRGLEFGEVVQEVKEVDDDEIVPPLRLIRRIATEADYRQLEENKEKEKEALRICHQKIEKHGLEMKLVDVEYTFDHNKIIFYFTADGRVDFRNLVRDLAAIFRTRIELRQIGVRDEAKIVGGLGPCGRPLCCATFLGDFGSVSIRMAKEQNLSLNPTKISGICGRLMCCLRYEADHYEGTRRCCPSPGDQVSTPHGEGKVLRLNILKQTVMVGMQENRVHREIPVGEVEKRRADKGEREQREQGKEKEREKQGKKSNGWKKQRKNR
ncbi:MAG TPA: stage 0 sporulation protein [Firmicutes bacterium]|nr:stage 0 sporulation protein [Bacillota bacterium]